MTEHWVVVDTQRDRIVSGTMSETEARGWTAELRLRYQSDAYEAQEFNPEKFWFRPKAKS